MFSIYYVIVEFNTVTVKGNSTVYGDPGYTNLPSNNFNPTTASFGLKKGINGDSIDLNGSKGLFNIYDQFSSAFGDTLAKLDFKGNSRLTTGNWDIGPFER